MLIKKSLVIMDGILKPLRRLVRIRSVPAVALLGSFALLPGFQLHAQDLLKEYIYLDGRLLAVERQAVTLTAQQPAKDADKAAETNFALNRPSGGRNVLLPGSNCETGMQGIRSTWKKGAFHSPVLAGDACPDNEQSPFMADSGLALQYGAYPRYWMTTKTFGNRNGGNDDGL
jgi:hypothetical protein